MCCLLGLGSCKSNMKESDQKSKEQNLGSICPGSVQTNTEIGCLTYLTRWLKPSVCLKIFNYSILGTSTIWKHNLWSQHPVYEMGCSEIQKIRLNSLTELKHIQQIGQIKLGASGEKQDKSICLSMILHPLTERERWPVWEGRGRKR